MVLLIAHSVHSQNSGESRPSVDNSDNANISTGLIELDLPKEELRPSDPKKANYTEQRFASLFNSRNPKRPRLPPPKHLIKPKPTLPSFIRSAPSVEVSTFAPIVRQTSSSRPRVTPATQSSRRERTSAPRQTTSRPTSTTPSSASRRSRAREALAASGALPQSQSDSTGRRRFGGSGFQTRSTTPRSR